MAPLKKQAIIVALAAAAFGGLWAVGRYLPALRAPFFPPPEDIAKIYLPEDSVPPEAVNETNLPLKLPPGFKISIFAKNLPGVRVMRFDSFGNMWVSRTSQGAVTLLELRDGKVVMQDDVFTGLTKPHGLAFDPEQPLWLYIAEEHRVWRVVTYSDDPGEEVLALPSGEGHFTRTIAFGPASVEASAFGKPWVDKAAGQPDRELYVSIGSSCNVCLENNKFRATIMRYDPVTKAFVSFATGLRNAVFFTWDHAGKMWATEMGRDWLGDDLPPDEIVIVEEGSPSTPFRAAHYGWPYCYGKQVRDSTFEPATEFSCRETEPSAVDIPAHSAPLGLAFIPPRRGSGQAGTGWPEEYWYDLLVAYHGSWNRSQPTGYKVVRLKLNAEGHSEGVEDFITGWLTPEGALGRPVDILIDGDGVMYLSDDKAGVIYRVTWRGM